MAEWIELTFGNVRWEVSTSWRDLLFDGQGLRLAEWRAQGLLEAVKEAPYRAVYRVNLPGRLIYVKHYTGDGVRSWLRQLVRPSNARGEFEHAISMAARKVPTSEPLAVGEALGGESYLITRGLSASEPLNQFVERAATLLAPDQHLRFRLHLAEELAKLLAHMHDTGVRHGDLHTGNLLVQLEPDGRPILHLIDLHEVRLGPSLDWRDSCGNLVMLNRWFLQRSSRTDRLRFWLSYAAKRKALRISPEQERLKAKELEAKTWSSCVGFWSRRDRRCLANNRHFYRLRHQDHYGWAARDLPLEDFRRLLADPDAPFQSSACRLLKDCDTSTVAEFDLTIGGEVQPMIYKRFLVTKWSDPLLSLVRPTRALRSWINGHRLLECGLPTAKPLAVIHRRRHGLIHESYLLTEKLAEACELHKYVESLGQLTPPERRVRLLRLMGDVARLVRALHQRALSQRDLKASNILVSTGPAGSKNETPQARLFLVDLVGMKRWRKLPQSRRVQNLARLHASFHNHPWISRTDKLRFLRVYLAWGLHGQAGWKRWWREIAEGTQEKIVLNQRRARPLT